MSRLPLPMFWKFIMPPVMLSAFILPGAGQLYNRDWRKGLVLIGLTFLLSMSLIMGAGPEIAGRITQDSTSPAFTQVREILKDIMERNAIYNLLMMLTWLYSLVDAYLGGRVRMMRLKPPSSSDESIP